MRTGLPDSPARLAADAAGKNRNTRPPMASAGRRQVRSDAMLIWRRFAYAVKAPDDRAPNYIPLSHEALARI